MCCDISHRIARLRCIAAWGRNCIAGKEAVRIVLQYNYCIAGWKGHEAG